MKKAISIILAAGLIPWAIPAHAADMEIKSILDPVEKIIMINGNLSSGPDGIISVSVSDEAGTTVFADELISGEDGEFRTSFDVGGFLDGKYTASFKSSDSEAATYSFVLPAEATAAEKLRISADKNVLLIKNGAPDEEYSQIVLTVENAKLMRGNLSSEDFSVQGLPAGYTLEG